jgi:hypothetical protein
VLLLVTKPELAVAAKQPRPRGGPLSALPALAWRPLWRSGPHGQRAQQRYTRLTPCLTSYLFCVRLSVCVDPSVSFFVCVCVCVRVCVCARLSCFHATGPCMLVWARAVSLYGRHPLAHAKRSAAAAGALILWIPDAVRV